MKDTKLIDLLKNLGKEEFKEFEKFISSPYFSRGRDVTSLLKTLKQFYPEFTNEKLTDEYLIKSLFKNKKSELTKSYSLLKTLTSELFKLGKEFLSYSEFNNDVNRKNYYLLNQLRKKKLYKEFEKEYKTSIQFQEINDTGNAEDFLNKYFLCLADAEYCVETGRYKNAYEALFKMAENSVFAALIRSFRLSEMKEVSKNFTKIETGFNLSEFLIENIDVKKFIHGISKRKDEMKFLPLIEISYMVHEMTLHREKTEYFFRLKDLFYNNLKLLGQSERYMLSGILGSYCISMMDEHNKPEFRNELIELYDKSLELGFYKFKNEDDFSLSLFRNIVLTFTGYKNLDWLENFIHNFYGELNLKYRDSMKYYSLTYLYFAKQEYGKALENLIKVKYDFFLFKNDVKSMYVKIYYEMNYTEQCYSMIDSMKHYISTTKDLNDTFKKRIGNFIKYSAELLKMKSSGKKSNAGLIKKQIQKEEYIEMRRWLINKAEELV